MDRRDGRGLFSGAVRSAPTTPILAVLDASADPALLVDHWRRLERFGHARRRTVVVRSADSALALHHVSPPSERNPAVEDVFLWGLLGGLLERCGTQHLALRLSSPRDSLLYADGRITIAQRPRRTDTLHLTWAQDARPAQETVSLPANDAPIVARVDALLAQDPATALHASPRATLDAVAAAPVPSGVVPLVGKVLS